MNDLPIIRDDFLALINAVCGFFMDSQKAFFLLRKDFDESDKLTMDMLRRDHPDLANGGNSAVINRICNIANYMVYYMV